MNSNTFQDAPAQALSYKFGSLSHTDPAVRKQAIEHNVDCITLRPGGRLEGADDLGRRRLELSRARAISPTPSSAIWNPLKEIYAALPDRLAALHRAQALRAGLLFDRRAGLGHQLSDRQHAWRRAFCLVDLGHHAPKTNIEMIVARLIQFRKLGGFHFNDSKYGDDDLDSGAINPYQLFLVFNELVDAELAGTPELSRPHDRPVAQRHRPDRELDGLGDGDRARLRAGASRRPRGALDLSGHERRADGERDVEEAFRTDVEPILAMARHDKGAAIEPVAHLSRLRLSPEDRRRPAQGERGGGGIV